MFRFLAEALVAGLLSSKKYSISKLKTNCIAYLLKSLKGLQRTIRYSHSFTSDAPTPKHFKFKTNKMVEMVHFKQSEREGLVLILGHLNLW